MNAIAIHRPGLLGHKVINEVFDNFFSDFPNHLKASTQGYPVADIYRDDDGSTVLEFALAGFKRGELNIDVQPAKRTITITGTANEENTKRSRIARRNFSANINNTCFIKIKKHFLTSIWYISSNILWTKLSITSHNFKFLNMY